MRTMMRGVNKFTNSYMATPIMFSATTTGLSYVNFVLMGPNHQTYPETEKIEPMEDMSAHNLP